MVRYEIHRLSAMAVYRASAVLRMVSARGNCCGGEVRSLMVLIAALAIPESHPNFLIGKVSGMCYTNPRAENRGSECLQPLRPGVASTL